ncbi:MAG TPA: hypothetical protein PLR41_01190 [Alphaproteobacteria bacterium]|nr:hypothetical protein [Alphaproteobacteria bacterium]
MKEYTRDQSAADLAADLAYVRLKSGERPFKPYGETLALPGVSTKLQPSRKIPANEGTTALYTNEAERAFAAAVVPQAEPVAMPTAIGENVVSLSDARSQRKTPRF